MLTLHSGEKILKIVHKHWFALIPQALLITALLLFPLVIPFTLQISPLPFNEDVMAAFIRFAGALYFLIVSIITLTIWIDYYLDMWIITNSRIIDIEQHGLFNREISEIPMGHIQDVTTETTGVVQTLLRFGTIRIQTAGEREFVIHTIPHLEEVKEIILKNKNTNIKV